MDKPYVLSTYQGYFNQFLLGFCCPMHSQLLFVLSSWFSLDCWNKTSNYSMTCNSKVKHQYNPCKTMYCTLEEKSMENNQFNATEASSDQAHTD